MSKNLAIKINKLFKSYDDVKAVQGIDLEINKGEFYGLLGPNGAGKSTTINSITSLVKPSDGDIEIFGNQDIQINVDKTESVDGVLDLGVALDASMTFSQKWNVTTGSDLIINSQSILDVDAIGNITMTTPANVDVDGARIDLN